MAAVTLCVLLRSTAANLLFGGFSWRNAVALAAVAFLGATITEAVLSRH